MLWVYSVLSDCDGFEIVALFISTESVELRKLSDSGLIAALKLPNFLGGDSNASTSATAANSGNASGSKQRLL